MQGDDIVDFSGTPVEGRWEALVVNSIYATTVSVKVADGRLTVDAIGGSNTKINYISIQQTSTLRP